MYNLIIGLIAIAACLCFYLPARVREDFKKYIWVASLLLLAVAAYFFISKVAFRITHPEIWDYTAFYLYGKVAADGHNFYVPENFHLVFNTLPLGAMDTTAFVDEVVNVGFPYPPPTMLLFAPLGMLSYKTALVVWTIFNSIFALGSILLSYNLFLKKHKSPGLILVMTLFFIFSPVLSTVFFSQTNFILLFLLLLMKKYETKPYAGIFLALAMFTKPYMVVFFAYFLFRKQWKTLLVFFGTALVWAGLAALVFGTTVFHTYLFNNSVNRLPAWVFAETLNQSLHAVLLRAKVISVEKPMIYMAIAGSILLATAGFLLYLVKQKKFQLMWSTLLLVGLLIYPGTLAYYGTLLLFVIYQFFDEENELGMKAEWVVPLVGVLFVLGRVSVFASICLLLALVIWKAFYPQRPYKLTTV